MAELHNLILRLADHRVDFVIVGGYAAAAHGVTLLTQDVDMCCEFSRDNLSRLAAALEGMNPVHRMTPDRRPAEIAKAFDAGIKNLYLDTDLGQLDCLSEVLGVGDFDRVKADSVSVEVDGRSISILSLAALIQAKKAMNRPRDREAVVQLTAILKRLS